MAQQALSGPRCNEGAKVVSIGQKRKGGGGEALSCFSRRSDSPLGWLIFKIAERKLGSEKASAKASLYAQVRSRRDRHERKTMTTYIALFKPDRSRHQGREGTRHADSTPPRSYLPTWEAKWKAVLHGDGRVRLCPDLRGARRRRHGPLRPAAHRASVVRTKTLKSVWRPFTAKCSTRPAEPRPGAHGAAQVRWCPKNERVGSSWEWENVTRSL